MLAYGVARFDPEPYPRIGPLRNALPILQPLFKIEAFKKNRLRMQNLERDGCILQEKPVLAPQHTHTHTHSAPGLLPPVTHEYWSSTSKCELLIYNTTH